jgi:hypothetical protein
VRGEGVWCGKVVSGWCEVGSNGVRESGVGRCRVKGRGVGGCVVGRSGAGGSWSGWVWDKGVRCGKEGSGK